MTAKDVGSGALFGDYGCEGSSKMNSDSHPGSDGNWFLRFAGAASIHLGCTLRNLKVLIRALGGRPRPGVERDLLLAQSAA